MSGVIRHMVRWTVAVLLLTGCVITGPPAGIGVGRTAKGPVVVVPHFIEGETRTRLRSVLAWPEAPVQVRLPKGQVLALSVVPGSAGVLIKRAGDEQGVSGAYNEVIRLVVEGGVLELVVEYP